MSSVIYHLTLNAYHEARGEPDSGVKAVTKVVLNRARKRKQGVEAVIYAPSQFEWTADSIPNTEITDYKAYRRCRRLVEEAIDEWVTGDIMAGADHYHGDYIKTPYWAVKMQYIDHIGKHLFYRS